MPATLASAGTPTDAGAAPPIPEEPVGNAGSVEFDRRQQTVLCALAAGSSKVDAARAAGVHRDTVNAWERKVPGFGEAVQQAQRDYRASLARQLRRLSVKAVDQLESLLSHPDTPPSVRLRAIQLVLTRPRFPATEWVLPENLNPAPIQTVQEPMDLLDAETHAAMQYDKLKAKSVGNVESLRPHLPVASYIPNGSSPAASDENLLDDVGSAGSKVPLEAIDAVTAPPQSPKSTPTPHGEPSSMARNSKCSCGSGQKYKRCCGKSAPPLLQTKAA